MYYSLNTELRYTVKKTGKVLLFIIAFAVASLTASTSTGCGTRTKVTNNASNNKNTYSIINTETSNSGQNGQPSSSGKDTRSADTETVPGAYQSRNWSHYMNMPTKAQTEAASNIARSPYIAIYPRYSGVSRLSAKTGTVM